MKRRLAFGVIFVVFLTVCGLVSCGKKEEAAVSKPATAKGIKIETVRLSPAEEEYEAVGTVRSKTTSVLSSKIVGNILVVHVHEGEGVRTGQLLIELDDRDTRAQLRKAEAGLREMQDGLEEIEQNIRAAEAAKGAAEAGRSLAQATYNRYKALLEQKSASPQEFDEVQAKLKVAEAEADRAERMLKALAAKKNQILAKTDQVKADIAAAQVLVGYSRIVSPINGVVVSRQAEVGALAAPGVPLLTVEDNARYRLEVPVEDAMVGKIRLGMPVKFSIDGLGSQEFSSRVTEIVPVSDPGTRSFTVKIDLSGETLNSQGLLRSGLYGKTRFSIGQKQIIQVPSKAILQRGQLVGVFVVDASHLLKMRLIKTGKTYGDRIEVLSGIIDEEQVVVDGVENAKEGDEVK